MTPSIESYCKDDLYVNGMAKRHLLEWTRRKDFSQSVLSLDDAVGDLKELHSFFQLQPPIECDSELIALLGNASKAVSMTTTMLSVIAGVSALNEMEGVVQQEACTKLQDNADIPTGLRAAIAAAANSRKRRKAA